ncbi:MAG: AbrB/MazE/SpoVT family DNA-binding domain-containing protein [Candidatus Woesearchaeota archaeon]|nr:AbrB/MazE/SpoVT family DNA-binding domain-containing protein [Candidatus Woesearchaeota archaeon]
MVSLRLTASVGEKGQVVIPKPVRDLLGITPHNEVVFSVQEDKVVLEKKDPKQAYLEFIMAVKDKIKMPKKVDWDELCTLT